MFILRAKRNKQGKVLRQGMTVLFFTVGEEFLDQEQLHPKNLKKKYEARWQPCPCSHRLALTLHRKMNVDGSKNAMRTRTVSLQASQRGCRVF